jgi:TonB-dependent SusC/RagA subfamily outer membrane receptor
MREILTHERTHARELHSLDVVFFELLRIAFWFNPFAWLTKASVHRNLEYLADKDVIRSGSDRRQYQYRLLQLCCRQSLPAITNHFSKSQLKNRIAMMNKKQTPKRGIVKYMFVLPLTFAFLLLANVETVPIHAADLKIYGDSVHVSGMKHTSSGLDEQIRNLVPKGENPPIIILDGKEITMEKMNRLDRNDIKSVAVLKDATAKEIYGDKGANGVIVIETVMVKSATVALKAGDDGKIVVKDGEIVVNMQGDTVHVSGLRATSSSLDIHNLVPNGENPPIIILDGKEITMEKMNRLDRNDIKSVTVLKDATAKIYGDKGANGVIIIDGKIEAKVAPSM